jgi:hypothetical protein
MPLSVPGARAGEPFHDLGAVHDAGTLAIVDGGTLL